MNKPGRKFSHEEAVVGIALGTVRKFVERDMQTWQSKAKVGSTEEWQEYCRGRVEALQDLMPALTLESIKQGFKSEEGS